MKDAPVFDTGSRSTRDPGRSGPWRTARPPRVAELLLSLRLEHEFREFELGDLAQEYAHVRAARGVLAARAWYWWQLLRTLNRGGSGIGPRRPSEERRQRRGGTLDMLRRDVLLALRSFARAPLFTGAAVLTLALGIGATTAVFSLADAYLFRPIGGIEAPEDVAEVWVCRPGRTPTSCSMSGMTYPNLQDVAGRLRTASGLAGWVQAGEEEIVVGNGAPLSLSPMYVSASYFEVLSARPHLGRTFTAQEAAPVGGAPVAVISYRLWTSAFARSPEVLGAEMLIAGKPFTVIGVAERGFHGTDRGDVDVWLPPSTMPWVNNLEGDMSERGGSRDFIYLVTRRQPDASWEQVRAELDSFSPWLAEQYPEANAKFSDVHFRVHPNVGAMPGQAVTMMAAFLAVVGLILLIACSNVSSLLLIRGLRRRGEMAVRKALGASTGRLIGQQLTESVTLWLMGGAAGTALAWALIRVVDRTIPDLSTMMMLDERVLTFVAVLSLLVGLVFGTLPALTVSRVEAARWLGQGTPAATSGRGRLRGVLTAVQLAATLTLLVGALLMSRALDAVASVDLGFEPGDVTLFTVNPGDLRYDDADRAEYYRELLRRLRSDPSVEDAELTMMAPFLSNGVSSAVRLAGDEGDGVSVSMTSVGPRFFDVLEIPLQAGRTFTEEEYLAGTPSRSVILGAATARRLFGGDDPLGRLVDFPRQGDSGPRYRVVGVVGDIRASSSSLSGDFDPMLYEPFAAAGSIPSRATFLVRARSGNTEIGQLVRSIAAALDEDTRVTGLQPHEDAVTRFYGATTIMTRVTGSLALLAAILAAVGLYGVVGVAADARMREFGLRVALGASPSTLLGAVAREAAGVLVAGLLLGVLGSLGLGAVIESFLYGVSPLDPFSWLLATLLLGLVAALAIVGPARRATSLDPVEVLRAG